MIKKIKKWVNTKASVLTIALSNVEKNALTQTNEMLGSDINQTQRHTQGQLADALINGIITQEVKNLRWRTYKVLKESEGLTTEFIGYDADGMPITKTKKNDNKRGLKKVKLDSFDNYPLEMVIDNSEIIISGNEVMDNKYIDVFDDAVTNYNDDNEIISVTHGEVKSDEFFISNKGERPINVIREVTPKFNIENYTKKLNIRKISDTEKLLEFYISKYPNEHSRTSKFFINHLKKVIENPRGSDLFEIKEVDFITYKSIGTYDFLEYRYVITSFDKIIEYDGSYVVKYKANVVINGDDILTKYIEEELEDKYKNKEKK